MTLFTIISVGAALTSGMSPSLDLRRPADLDAGILEADALLDFAGDCIDRHPQWRLDSEYRRTEKRLWAAVDRDEGVWGSKPMSAELPDIAPTMKCRKSDARASLKRAHKALDTQDAAFVSATKGIEHGVWVGSIKLCRDSVLEANQGIDELTKQPQLSIKLTSWASSSFGSLTRRSINRRLAVRLDGAIISRPNVYEPMENGTLQITGPDEVILKRVSRKIQEDVC